MTPDRAKLLAELLDEIREKDRGFIPEGAWYSVQKTFNLSYVEVFIARKREGGQYEFLLVYRDDEHFTGWEIPGGRWKTGLTRAEACNDVAQRELGIKVYFVAEVMSEDWHDHPYGYPISHVCLCEAMGEVEETPHRRYSSEIPEIITSHHHKGFIRQALEFLARKEKTDG